MDELTFRWKVLPTGQYLPLREAEMSRELTLRSPFTSRCGILSQRYQIVDNILIDIHSLIYVQQSLADGSHKGTQTLCRRLAEEREAIDGIRSDWHSRPSGLDLLFVVLHSRPHDEYRRDSNTERGSQFALHCYLEQASQILVAKSK